MQLLPPKPGVCPVCAVDHTDDMPHNQQSLYYQYRFYLTRGRWPTWADAIAHCSPNVQASWREVLQKAGEWSEPEDGQPIADPLGESVHQPVGDLSQPGLVPEQEGQL